MKYFYTCPFIAGYMSKHFGVKYEDDGWIGNLFNNVGKVEMEWPEEKHKFTVLPELGHIFSDVTTISFNDGASASFKDGKFLFMPEIENNNSGE